MSPTPTISKPITVKFTGATANDPVAIENLTTGERVNKHPDGTLLRLESRQKGIIYDVNNFSSGWTVGDVISVSIGGTKAGTQLITLTADTESPQDATVTANAVSTAVLTI